MSAKPIFTSPNQPRSIEDRLDAIETTVYDIRRAMIGDPEYKQPGIINRLDNNERAVADQATVLADHSKRFWAISILGTFVSAVLATVIAAWLKN